MSRTPHLILPQHSPLITRRRALQGMAAGAIAAGFPRNSKALMGVQSVWLDGYTYFFNPGSLATLITSTDSLFLSYWYRGTTMDNNGQWTCDYALIAENQFTVDSTGDDHAQYCNGFWVVHRPFYPNNGAQLEVVLSGDVNYDNFMMAFSDNNYGPAFPYDGGWHNVEIACDLTLAMDQWPVIYAIDGIISGATDGIYPPPMVFEVFGGPFSIPVGNGVMYNQVGTDYPDNAPTTSFLGDLAELVVWWATPQDVEPADVARFIDISTGRAVSLGSSGSAPFGAVPPIYLHGNTSGAGPYFPDNRGDPWNFEVWAIGGATPGWATSTGDPF